MRANKRNHSSVSQQPPASFRALRLRPFICFRNEKPQLVNALGHLFAPGNPRPSPFRLIKISKVCVSLCILKLMRVFSSQSARPSPKAVRRALDFPTYPPFQNTERCETKQPMSLVANALLLAGTSHDGTAIHRSSIMRDHDQRYRWRLV